MVQAAVQELVSFQKIRWVPTKRGNQRGSDVMILSSQLGIALTKCTLHHPKKVDGTLSVQVVYCRLEIDLYKMTRVSMEVSK